MYRVVVIPLHGRFIAKALEAERSAGAPSVFEAVRCLDDILDGVFDREPTNAEVEMYESGAYLGAHASCVARLVTPSLQALDIAIALAFEAPGVDVNAIAREIAKQQWRDVAATIVRWAQAHAGAATTRI